MNFLKDMYPQVDKELLESVWTVAEGNVFDALELLRSNVGSDTKIKDSTSISEKEVAHSSQVKETMPTSTVDCSGCRTCLVEDGTAVYCQPFIKDEQPKLAMAPSSSPPLRWPSRKKVPVQEEENSPVSALQVYIAVRQLVPNVTFNDVRTHFDECPSPRPANLAELISQKLLPPSPEIPPSRSTSPSSSPPTLPPPQPTTIECGCCFIEYPPHETIACPNPTDPHSFCLSCLQTYASNQIGQHKHTLQCMHTSETCTHLFTDSQIRAFLPSKTHLALEKLRTAAELREAEIEGIVHCPFCDFAAIMEDPTDRVFECLNEECGIKSCRYCRVKSHQPMSCEQYQKERHIDAKHLVEEAMTTALLRVCATCNKAILKDGGCNKILCSCGTYSCYICNTANVTYDHFSDDACPLYDDTEKRLRREVAKAQTKAVKEVVKGQKEKGEGVKEEDVTVDPALWKDLKSHSDDEQDPNGEQINGRRRNARRQGAQDAAEESSSEDDLLPFALPQNDPFRQWQRQQRRIQRQLEREEEAAAIAAVLEFERLEQIRLAEEARIASLYQRQRQLSEDLHMHHTMMYQPTGATQTQIAEKVEEFWNLLVMRSEALFCSWTEERDITDRGNMEEIEEYWNKKRQCLEEVIRDAQLMVVTFAREYQSRRRSLPDDMGLRYKDANDLLNRATAEMERYKKEAQKRKHANRHVLTKGKRKQETVRPGSSGSTGSVTVTAEQPSTSKNGGGFRLFRKQTV